MADGTPTVRQRQLGMALRYHRDAAGKGQDEAATHAEVTASALSRYETGKRRIRPRTVEKLLEFYGVGSPHTEALVKLAQEADQRDWWAAYGTNVPSYFADYLGMEPVADEVLTYESEYVPGLFQTEEYAEVFAANSASDLANRFVELRAARQRRLTDDNPLTVRAVLNEAVLRRVIGCRDLMRAQVRHMIGLVALPNVTIRVLPFSARAHGAMTPFVALRFPDEPLNTVYIELNGGALYLEKPKDVERYVKSFEQLSGLAMSEEQTIEFLEQEAAR